MKDFTEKYDVLDLALQTEVPGQPDRRRARSVRAPARQEAGATSNFRSTCWLKLWTRSASGWRGRLDNAHVRGPTHRLHRYAARRASPPECIARINTVSGRRHRIYILRLHASAGRGRHFNVWSDWSDVPINSSVRAMVRVTNDACACVSDVGAVSSGPARKTKP